MPDVFTKRNRSEVMSRIRGRGNNETELGLVKVFRAHRLTGWRRNQPVVRHLFGLSLTRFSCPPVPSFYWRCLSKPNNLTA